MTRTTPLAQPAHHTAARLNARDILLAGVGAIAWLRRVGALRLQSLADEGRLAEARLQRVTEERAERMVGGILTAGAGTVESLRSCLASRLDTLRASAGLPDTDQLEDLKQRLRALERHLQQLELRPGPGA